jgi:hypothetical protein
MKTTALFLLVLCASDCVVDVPEFGADCDVTTRPSGIQYLVFFSCDFQFDATVDGEVYGPITDYTQWALGVTNKKISLSPEGYGAKPLSAFQTERVTACLPESIIGETHTVNFISKAMDEVALTDCTYWNTVRTNFNRYRVGYIGCDGYFYGKSTTEPGFRFTPTAIGNVKEDNNDTVDRYEANLSWKYSGIVCPQSIPNLLDAFTGDSGS